MGHKGWARLGFRRLRMRWRVKRLRRGRWARQWLGRQDGWHWRACRRQSRVRRLRAPIPLLATQRGLHAKRGLLRLRDRLHPSMPRGRACRRLLARLRLYGGCGGRRVSLHGAQRRKGFQPRHIRRSIARLPALAGMVPRLRISMPFVLSIHTHAPSDPAIRPYKPLFDTLYHAQTRMYNPNAEPAARRGGMRPAPKRPRADRCVQKENMPHTAVKSVVLALLPSKAALTSRLPLHMIKGKSRGISCTPRGIRRLNHG